MEWLGFDWRLFREGSLDGSMIAVVATLILYKPESREQDDLKSTSIHPPTPKQSPAK
jgi:hypothetical protein